MNVYQAYFKEKASDKENIKALIANALSDTTKAFLVFISFIISSFSFLGILYCLFFDDKHLNQLLTISFSFMFLFLISSYYYNFKNIFEHKLFNNEEFLKFLQNTIFTHFNFDLKHHFGLLNENPDNVKQILHFLEKKYQNNGQYQIISSINTIYEYQKFSSTSRSYEFKNINDIASNKDILIKLLSLIELNSNQSLINEEEKILFEKLNDFKNQQDFNNFVEKF